MTREELCAKRQEALENISFQGELVSCEPYGSGHINDTFLAVFRQTDGSSVKYILQRMNHEIFTKPAELMENILNVTAFLGKKIKARGGDDSRETMTVIPAKDGKPYFKDSIGSWWRGYAFINDTVSLDTVEKPEHFYQSAVAFGNFQSLLSDYPADTLHETIVNFHNTEDRYQKFLKAVEEDIKGRAAEVAGEIAFVKERAEFCGLFNKLQKEGKLPLRVTHNDTKLNNVMLDAVTGKPVCVIDLDTVMPGFSVNDYGDSIRFGASTGAEDEPDLSKVNLNLELVDLYTKGYLEGCKGSLTDEELNQLPAGAKMMTFECGMRFLTDYLQGDVYFRTHRPGQNLDRTRTQFKLVADMEKHWDEMKAIVDKYR